MRALWSELTHLNIEGCQLLTDGALLALTEAKLPLTWLNYSYCLNITDAGVTHVATKCAKLQVRTHALVLPVCTPKDIRSRVLTERRR